VLGLVQYLIGFVGLGLMVFVHELGHFVAARLNGVAVEVFSLGWGPKLLGFTRGGTRYQVSWFLIGGYCKMKGELVPGLAGGEGGAPGQGTADPAARQHAAGSFLAASPWRRICISAFGPLFNLLFAALVFTAIWWAGFQVASPENRIVLATDYTLDAFPEPPPATVAGLRTGDRVIAIDGRPVEKHADLLQAVVPAPGRALHFTVERPREDDPAAVSTITLTVTPRLDKATGAGRIGIYAWEEPVIGSVARGGAADMAGLQPGDRIVSVAGIPVRNSTDFRQALAPARAGRVELSYERQGELRTAALILSLDAAGELDPGMSWAWRTYLSPRLSLGGAALRGLAQTGETIGLVVKSVGLLFRGISIRNAVAGPLQITRTIGRATTEGLANGIGAGLNNFFGLLALFSISLFLMNLLPLPALDGGQIVLFAVEAVRRRPVRPQLHWRLQIIGFTLLIILFLLVTLNDFFMRGGR
jgi:regulator of sigma E protease